MSAGAAIAWRDALVAPADARDAVVIFDGRKVVKPLRRCSETGCLRNASPRISSPAQ